MNFKTIPVKDYETHKAKLSWNEFQLTHLKTSSMNKTNQHTSRIKIPICPEKEKKKTTFDNFYIYLNVNYA